MENLQLEKGTQRTSNIRNLAHPTQCDQSRNQVISVFRNMATIRITFGNMAFVGQKS